MAKAISRSKQKKRRIHLRVAASFMDLLGMLGSAALIILCVLLLHSLFVWVRQDFDITFATLKAAVLHAVLVGAK